MSDKKMDIREGDVWGFCTNTGTILRTIKSVGSKRIGYEEFFSGRFRVCLKSTFRRWWKGASLESATDWKDRKNI